MFMLCLSWGYEIFSTSHIFFKEFASLALTGRQKPFELMFVHGMRKQSNFILLQMVSSCKWYPVVPHAVYWNTTLSPSLNCLGTLDGNQLTVNMRIYFWNCQFYSIDLSVYPYDSVTQFYYNAIVSLKTRSKFSNFLLLLQNSFGSSFSLSFPYEF